MKLNQRLEYGRIAEILAERGMVDPQALQDILQASTAGGPAFAEALIHANLVGDWDLSAIVCETYGLPFVTVEICTPDPEVFTALDANFLQEHGVVPLSRFGQCLTVCMPGIVPAEVLGLLAAQTDLVILPVVGTVRTNRRWLSEHLQVPEETETMEEPLPPMPANGEGGEGGESAWGSIFDAGEAAVQMGLDDPVPPGELTPPPVVAADTSIQEAPAPNPETPVAADPPAGLEPPAVPQAPETPATPEAPGALQPPDLEAIGDPLAALNDPTEGAPATPPNPTSSGDPLQPPALTPPPDPLGGDPLGADPLDVGGLEFLDAPTSGETPPALPSDDEEITPIALDLDELDDAS